MKIFKKGEDTNQLAMVMEFNGFENYINSRIDSGVSPEILVFCMSGNLLKFLAQARQINPQMAYELEEKVIRSIKEGRK